jgi:hypothetical protein
LAIKTLPDAPFEDLGELPEDQVTVPDFRGLGIARVLELAHQAGVVVDVRGSGRAVRQDPPIGAVVRGTAVTVFFGEDRPVPSSP